MPAVRLVADDHDGAAAFLRDRADVVGRRARRQPLVDVGLGEGEERRGLAGAQQRAADDRVRLDAPGVQDGPELPRLRAAGVGERPQLVGVPRRGLGMANDHEAHRGQDNPPVAALPSLAVFALVTAVAVDGGGYGAVTWSRALVAVCAVLLLVRGSRPTRAGRLFVAALGGLTLWTALSYVWSESPGSALIEAQRVALYAAVALAVMMHRVSARAVVAAAVVVACWNLVTRADGIGASTGAGAEPIGYANALALLCVVALLLVPRRWWPAAAPLLAVLVLQDSRGAYGALAVGVLVRFLPRWRIAIAAAGIAVLMAVAATGIRGDYWRVAASELSANAVAGSGAGTYGNWWLRERTTPQSTTQAHSLYVETVAELGPIGLALALLALAVPLAAARRPEHAAALAAYAAGAAVDFDWQLAGVTLPVVVVGAIAVGRSRERLEVRPVAAALLVAAVLAYLGNAHLAAARDAARAGDFSRARTEASAAARWQPFSAQPWLVYGDAGGDPVVAYRKATQLDPASWTAWSRLAGVADGQLRRLAQAKAAQLNPMSR